MEIWKNDTMNETVEFNVTDERLGSSTEIVSTITGLVTAGLEGLSQNESLFNETLTDILYHPCYYRPEVPFDCNKSAFLEAHRGPQQLPIITALAVTILFVGIFVTGVIGNLIVCVVIVKHAAMHTATNYYLFSLAVSDLIFLMMGLPNEITLYWHQYPYNMGLAFCKIRAWISEASTYVSVLTIVAFSMERFLAICHPLHSYRMSGLRRAIRIIAVLWTMSFISAVPFGVYTVIDYLTYPLDNTTMEESAFCMMPSNPGHLWEISTVVFFIIPMAVMVILYGRMGMRIRSRTRQAAELGKVQGSIHGETKSQSRKAIIRMLAAVVITFFVCWLPFHAQRIMYHYGKHWEYYNDINTWLFSVGGWLYYVSCTINPILYNVMSHRYRVAFKETLCGKKRGYYHSNGFARDQSSFRETTIPSSYDTSVGRSRHGTTRYTNRSRDRNQLTTGSVRFTDRTDEKSLLKKEPLLKPEENTHASDVIVYLGTNNGRQVCYTTTTTNSSAVGTPTSVGGAVSSNPTPVGNHLLNNNESNAMENHLATCKNETCI